MATVSLSRKRRELTCLKQRWSVPTPLTLTAPPIALRQKSTTPAAQTLPFRPHHHHHQDGLSPVPRTPVIRVFKNEFSAPESVTASYACIITAGGISALVPTGHCSGRAESWIILFSPPASFPASTTILSSRCKDIASLPRPQHTVNKGAEQKVSARYTQFKIESKLN